VPGTSFDEAVSDLALEMAWSQWAEYGVSAWVRYHGQAALDLEPLILLTCRLAAKDERLRDDALGWCVLNHSLVSAVRLRNLAPAIDPESYRQFAATVKVHARVNWPGDGDPYPFEPITRSVEPDLNRPALIQLQLRALVGVSARAEIFRVMLANPTAAHSASGLASQVAYGKGNVVNALEALAMARVIETEVVQNRITYRLARAVDLVNLLGGIPATFPDWRAIFRLTEALLRFAGAAPAQGPARAAAVRRLFDDAKSDLDRLGLSKNLPRTTGETLVTEFEAWSTALLRTWAGRSGPETIAGDPVFTVHRLGNGDWLATAATPGQSPSALELPERAETGSLEHPRSDAVIADDALGAPRLAHALIESARRAAGLNTDGFWQVVPGRPNNQLISLALAEGRLLPMRRGQTADFTAEFLRRWYEDRVESLRR
jgi:hypothetical protein